MLLSMSGRERYAGSSDVLKELFAEHIGEAGLDYEQGHCDLDVKGLEKLTQLKVLRLIDNPDLTKAHIDQLKKALPNCKILSNPKK